MDRLDHAIAEAHQELAMLQAQRIQIEHTCERLEARLAALKFAAEVRPSAEPETKRGRQPGAISSEWRQVLRIMRENSPLDLSVVASIAEHVGIRAELASIRDRMRLFEQRGYVSSDADGRYTVSDYAVSRFSLDKAGADADNEEADE